MSSDAPPRENSAAPVPSTAAPGAAIDLWDIVCRLGSVSVMAVIASTLPPLGAWAVLAYRTAIADWLQGFEPFTALAYFIVFSLAVGLALVPTQATAIAGGYILGFSLGLPATLAGFLGAAGVAYFIARVFSGDRALRLIREHPRARDIHARLLGAGYWRTLGLIILIRLPPSPFALTNLALAATNVPVSAYLLGTLIGMTPRITAMIYVGSHLKSLSDTGAPWWYFWGGVAATFVSLAIIGHVVNQAINRRWEAGKARA